MDMRVAYHATRWYAKSDSRIAAIAGSFRSIAPACVCHRRSRVILKEDDGVEVEPNDLATRPERVIEHDHCSGLRFRRPLATCGQPVPFSRDETAILTWKSAFPWCPLLDFAPRSGYYRANRSARGELFTSQGNRKVPLFHFRVFDFLKKTAVLIDAGFLRTFLPTTVAFQTLADIIEAFALACVSAADGEEMHRVLYYDCAPYDGDGRRKPHPLDRTREPTSLGYRNFFNSVLSLLKSKAYFAVRLGEVSFDGWALSDQATTEILAQGRTILADDFQPVLRQKGVDLRIGLDVALMAKDRLIDRIVVVSGDSDIVPAMKVARREGVQVVLTSLNHNVKASLREHADLYRNVDLQSIITSLYPGGLPVRLPSTRTVAAHPSAAVPPAQSPGTR